MAASNSCPLCGYDWPKNEFPTSQGHRTYFNCQRCGQFGAQTSLFESLSNLSANIRRALIVRLSEISAPRFGDTPVFFWEDFEAAEKRTVGVTEMAERLLSYCVKNSPSLRHVYDITDVELAKACIAFDPDETLALAEYLLGLGFTQVEGNILYITPSGYRYVQEGRGRNIDSAQGFVAMWFTPELDSVFERGFLAGIADSGHSAFRIDKKEHNQKIDDEIIAEIRKSKFLVADFTGHRGGVYFEAGFAMGLGLQIIWCCRKDQISELHFDIRQYNCIDWSTAEELRTRLSNRIVALMGLGPRKSEA